MSNNETSTVTASKDTNNKPLEILNLNETNAFLKQVTDPRDYAIVTLFLTTGIFLNELQELTIDSIDWSNKVLKVEGSRSRELALNEQAFNALARWSKERPDTQSKAFFITTKGAVKELSARSIDHLIRKYAKEAGIKRAVNAQILRSTFAVRLFSQEITLAKASAILGIKDHQSLSRYAQTAEDLKTQTLPVPADTVEEMKVADTRSSFRKWLDGMFPIKPRQAKAIVPIKGAITANPEEVIIGRDHVIDELRASLNKGQSVLVTGQLGVGKTHLLKHLVHVVGSNALYIASPTPTKAMLETICDKLNPDWQTDLKSRSSAKELIDYLGKLKPAQPPVLVIDNFNVLKVSDVETVLFLLENFTVLASSEELIPRLKQLWGKFKQVELRPLTDDNAKELIKYLTQNLSISDYDLLETRILGLSNKLPMAIVDIVKQISFAPVVTRHTIRDIYMEVGVKYRDWTLAIIVLWGIMIMFRFVALGTHSFEGYILAGFGMSVLMVMRFFMFRMR